MGRPVKALLFAGVFAGTALLAIDFCGWFFRCGCQSVWLASAAHCNIHHATGPHCPWCTYGGTGFVVSMVPVFAAQAVAIFRPGPWNWKPRLGLAVAAFPVIGGILGGIVGWMQGYWNH